MTEREIQQRETEREIISNSKQTTNLDFEAKSLLFLLDGRMLLSGRIFWPCAFILDFKAFTVALYKFVTFAITVKRKT